MKENGKRKRKEKNHQTVFTLHLPSSSLIHVQLPATITTSTKQSEVAERVREGCSRDTVYRFAPRRKYYIFNLQRQLHCSDCTHTMSHLLKGRGTVDTCGQQAQRCRGHAWWKRTYVPMRTSSTSSSPFPWSDEMIDPTIFNIIQKMYERRVHSCVFAASYLETFEFTNTL